eukprot:4185234-Alexandrium_andersonii.AAC.1
MQLRGGATPGAATGAPAANLPRSAMSGFTRPGTAFNLDIFESALCPLSAEPEAADELERSTGEAGDASSGGDGVTAD